MVQDAVAFTLRSWLHANSSLLDINFCDSRRSRTSLTQTDTVTLSGCKVVLLSFAEHLYLCCLLALQDCYVDVELPIKSTGPFIFQIRDPNQELLLRLSADNLKTAKTWVRTLAAAGLAIQGFERFRITSVYQGLNSSPSPNLELSSDGVARSAESTATGSAGFPPTISAPAGWGSKLGRALQSFTSFRNVHSTDSDLSVVRLPNAAAPAAAATRPAAPDAVPGIQAEAAASAFQQQQFLEGDGENSGDLRDIEHLKRMSTVTRSSYMATPPLTRAASTKR